MLKVLTLSTLFPNAAQPTLGIFVERQTRGLAGLGDVEVQVVAPVGLPPWPLSQHPHYRPLTRLPEAETWKGLSVHRPTYPVLPRIGQARTARHMANALLPFLRKLRKRFRFDVIDAEYFWPDGPAAMHLSRALGVPFSVKARGSDISHWPHQSDIGAQIMAAGAAASGLLAVSAAMKADMVALGISAEKIRVHHTGVDLDLFRPVDRIAAKAALGVQGPLLITVGALIPRKNQSVAIEALLHLPNATLLLVGEGPDRRALEAQIRSPGLEGRVRLLGSQPHDKVAHLLAAADAMVLPTLSEGLANVWVEALACGTPVVTTDVSGARDVIDRAEAGRIVPRDPSAIAAAVQDLLKAPPAADRVRAAATRFSWDRNAAELRDHLAQIAFGTPAVKAA